MVNEKCYVKVISAVPSSYIDPVPLVALMICRGRQRPIIVDDLLVSGFDAHLSQLREGL